MGAAILDRTSWGPPSWTGSRGGRHLGSDFVTSLALKWGLYYCYLHFSVMFLLKKKFVSTLDSEQSKTLLTIDERGSKLARNSVLIAKCRLFDE